MNAPKIFIISLILSSFLLSKVLTSNTAGSDGLHHRPKRSEPPTIMPSAKEGDESVHVGGQNKGNESKARPKRPKPPTTMPSVKEGDESVDVGGKNEENEPRSSLEKPPAGQNENEPSIRHTSSHSQELQTTISSKTNTEDFTNAATEAPQKPDENVTTRSRRPCRPQKYGPLPVTERQQ